MIYLLAALGVICIGSQSAYVCLQPRNPSGTDVQITCVYPHEMAMKIGVMTCGWGGWHPDSQG